jgi:hypothetical protein
MVFLKIKKKKENYQNIAKPRIPKPPLQAKRQIPWTTQPSTMPAGMTLLTLWQALRKLVYHQPRVSTCEKHVTH